MRTLNFDLHNWHYRNHLKNRDITILARALLYTSRYDHHKAYYTEKQTQNAFASAGDIDCNTDHFQVGANEPANLLKGSYSSDTFHMAETGAQRASTLCGTPFRDFYISPSIPQRKIKQHKNDDKTTNKISWQNDFRCMCRYCRVLQPWPHCSSTGLCITFCG